MVLYCCSAKLKNEKNVKKVIICFWLNHSSCMWYDCISFCVCTMCSTILDTRLSDFLFAIVVLSGFNLILTNYRFTWETNDKSKENEDTSMCSITLNVLFPFSFYMCYSLDLTNEFLQDDELFVEPWSIMTL